MMRSGYLPTLVSEVRLEATETHSMPSVRPKISCDTTKSSCRRCLNTQMLFVSQRTRELISIAVLL